MSTVGEIIDERGSYFVEWRMDFLSALSENDKHWYSPKFKFLDGSWLISIFMEVNASGQPNEWLSLYLTREDSNADFEVSVRFTLGLKTEGGILNISTSATHCFTNSSFCCGWSEAVKIVEVLHKLLNNRVIIVYCEMHLNQERRDAESQTIQHDEHAILAQNVADLYQNQQLSDITFNVRGREFQAHRSILAARSSVFASMFKHYMKVKQIGVITIDDCDPDDFQDFLLFLYTAKVDIISPKNVIALYRIAENYHLSQLTSGCERFLLLNLSVKMFCDVLTIAKNNSTLMKAAKDFFAKYMDEITDTETWQNLTKNNRNSADEFLLSVFKRVKN